MTFIGPKPEVDSPAYATPFQADGELIKDANGRRVGYADTPDADHDHEMAQAIADALNEKFSGKATKTTVSAIVYNRPNGDTSRWIVVDGEAYFQYLDDGKVGKSIWTPAQLAAGYGVDAEYGGYEEIDPALLVGVEGRS
jgi:hypothetical protein